MQPRQLAAILFGISFLSANARAGVPGWELQTWHCEAGANKPDDRMSFRFVDFNATFGKTNMGTVVQSNFEKRARGVWTQVQQGAYAHPQVSRACMASNAQLRMTGEEEVIGAERGMLFCTGFTGQDYYQFAPSSAGHGEVSLFTAADAGAAGVGMAKVWTKKCKVQASVPKPQIQGQPFVEQEILPPTSDGKFDWREFQRRASAFAQKYDQPLVSNLRMNKLGDTSWGVLSWHMASMDANENGLVFTTSIVKTRAMQHEYMDSFEDYKVLYWTAFFALYNSSVKTELYQLNNDMAQSMARMRPPGPQVLFQRALGPYTVKLTSTLRSNLLEGLSAFQHELRIFVTPKAAEAAPVAQGSQPSQQVPASELPGRCGLAIKCCEWFVGHKVMTSPQCDMIGGYGARIQAAAAQGVDVPALHANFCETMLTTFSGIERGLSARGVSAPAGTCSAE